MEDDIKRIDTNDLRVNLTKYLTKNLGEKYAIEQFRQFKTKSKGAQEAHEAIRPTDVIHSPEEIRQHLTNDQYRLYNLIWKRAVATQMAEEIISVTSVSIKTNDEKYQFNANGNIIMCKH